MFFAERIAEMTRKMLRKKLYVVMSKPAVPPEKLQIFLSAHLEYMIGLERRGHVFASAEAQALAEADPFFVNGLRTFELKEWTVMEGTLGVRVNLSDQSVEVT
jgi:hypothetical protein